MSPIQRLKTHFKEKQKRSDRDAERDSKLTVLEELFNDLYNDRKRIYKLNFIRGVMFGVGSAIGGTLAIAVIVWLLSLFVNVPLVGELFENAQQSIEQTTDEATKKQAD